MEKIMKNSILKRLNPEIRFLLSLFLFFLALSYGMPQDHFKRNISLKHFNEGVKLEEAGEMDKAIAAYQRAIDADPNNPYPFLNLGTIYFNQGDLLLAKEELE